MSLPEIVPREQWLAARVKLLDEEKELTRARDALNAQRRQLPMVLIDKDYRFEGPSGELGLIDLFEGRRQLIVGHFMFDPSWEDGCSSCTAGAVELAPGQLEHLRERDTTFAYVSRAPFARIDDYRRRQGWEFPWYSSCGSDFNYDFGVTIDTTRGEPVYNYRTVAEHHERGVDVDFNGEWPGRSCFLRDGDRVFHTYSVYARGLETIGGSYYMLDETALGRQEPWEEPKGRADHSARPFAGG